MPSESAACCLVHQLGKCDAVFTCCDRCPTFFADRAKPIYGKPFHGWSCDCDECKGYDERGEPRPGEAPRPQASAAPEMVACNAETGHQPHDWTFADDYPLMRCPGVECHVRRADPLDVDGPCPACHGPLRWHRPMEAIRA